MSTIRDAITTAGAIGLDEIGLSLDMERNHGEPDSSYRERLDRSLDAADTPRKIHTGGAAFPLEGSSRRNSQTGMTLRDYFAAKAMQAIVTNDEMIKRLDRLECYKGITSGICIAKEAYMLADFLLAERAK